MRNILVREPGRAQMVFVRCADCGELVARYRLRDYYHHGKDAESFLRSMGSQAVDSGREQLNEFNRVQEESVAAFEEVLEQLRSEGKDT